MNKDWLARCVLEFVIIVMSTSIERPEFDFVDWVQTRTRRGAGVSLGIGDDAAVLDVPAGYQLVSTVDVITEGRHFTPDTPPELIGRKALAVNLSDLAAMVAHPTAAFVGLVLPQNMNRDFVERIYAGLFALAEEFGVTIAGGDTNSWDGPLVISLTLMGIVKTGTAVTRSGAQPGDWLCVTGLLGGSLASGRHLSFKPRVREARLLKAKYKITSMLDLSDGLASDIRHLSKNSGVGFLIDESSIPVHTDVVPHLDFGERIHHALTDGEDFELLLTIAPPQTESAAEFLLKAGIPLWKIGECVSGDEIRLMCKGESRPLPAGGWCHRFGQDSAE